MSNEIFTKKNAKFFDHRQCEHANVSNEVKIGLL